jgi:hypothetical protein
MKGLVLMGLLCLIFALGVASPGAQADVRASKDSFLSYNAETVDALVKQIKAEPAVQKRFAKHYGKSADELATYFQNNLVVKPMASAETMIVYGCNSKGVIYPRRLTIRKDYPMFCLADGTPILKGRCGNPVGSELPTVVAVKPPEAPVKEEQPKEAEVAQPEVKEQLPEVPAVVPDVVAPPVAPEVESVEAEYPVMPTDMTDQTLIVPTVPGGGPSPFLFLLPVLALGGGGGGGGNVIPEPSSLAQFGIMGIGLAGLAWSRLRRRSK